jgi:hypothetical protein
MKKQSLFDDMIHKVIEEQMREIDVPDMDDIWLNIEEHIEEKNKRFTFRKKIIGIVVSVLLFACVGIGVNNEGYANYFRTLKIFSKTNENQTTIVQMDNKTPGEDREDIDTDIEVKQYANGMTEYVLPVARVKDIASFPFKEPAYLPEGYNIEEVTLNQLENKTMKISIVYASKNTSFRLTQEPIKGEYALGLKINADQGTIKEKIIKGYRYNVIEYNNGFIEVIWDIDEIKYILEGELAEEEFLKIAASIPRT